MVVLDTVSVFTQRIVDLYAFRLVIYRRFIFELLLKDPLLLKKFALKLCLVRLRVELLLAILSQLLARLERASPTTSQHFRGAAFDLALDLLPILLFSIPTVLQFEAARDGLVDW